MMSFGITLCVMLGLGALASAAVFDLEFTSGLTHAGLFILTIVLLALASGVTLAGAAT